MMNLGHLSRETDWILSSPSLSGFDFKDHDDIHGLTPATEEEIVSSVSFENIPISVPLPGQKERARNPPTPRAPLWNFLEDHRYAKSPRAFPKPTAPRPAPQIDSDEEPSTSSFASQQLSSRRMFPVPDKPKDPLADKFNFTSLASTTPSFSGSVLLASPKKPVIPEGGTLDPSKLVYRDVDALDAPSERREKKSITGRSQKYNLGNSHDPGNYSSVSTSFFGKKKTKHVTSHQMEPRQLSLTGDILLNDIIGDPESRRMRPPEKLAKIPRKKKKKSLASASRLSSSSDDNDDVFVWDTVKPKSKGKEARERSKAEEIARKEGKKSRKIAKEPKPSVKTPKKAVVKKAGSKSDTKKAKSTPLASEKKKEPKKRMSILASVTALASSKKKNKSKKPTLLTSPDTTTETHKAALPPSSTIDEDDGAVAVAGPSGIQDRKRPSTVWLNEDGRDEKYFNRNFSSVSLENVIVSPRRRNSSQSAFGVPEEEPAAAVAVARPVPPKKPKRKI